jgi:hypothetical protein
MLDTKNIIQLGKIVAKANASAPTSYSWNGESLSYDAMQETLRQEFAELAGSPALYRENKNTIFSIMEEILDDVLPKKVTEAYDQFAEVKTFAQGEKAVFTKKTGKQRAKQFITKVGHAGRYEVFKLATKTFGMEMQAVGGAAQIGLEEFLDGRVDFAELIQIVLETMDERVYEEIAKQLIAGIEALPTANKTVQTGFVAAEFDKLLAIASSYGAPAIYCTYEFAVKMIPDSAWISEAMKNERWAKGYFTRYKGYPVIILPQSYTDETNAVKVIDPSYAWIFAGDTKPVKVGFEGQTLVREVENEDWSREFQAYKKFGVISIMNSDVFSYRDSSLTV